MNDAVFSFFGVWFLLIGEMDGGEGEKEGM